MTHCASVSSFVSLARSFENEIFVALVVYGVCYFLLDAWREWRKNLPPGPYGLPILGYVPFISDWDLQKLGKKYGDVFSVYIIILDYHFQQKLIGFKMGSKTIVVLHGVQVIKEALARPELLGRPPDGHWKLFNANSAFFMDDVKKWREQRRFVLRSMKELGLGKTQIEGEIMDEIHHFLDKLRSHNGSPLDVNEPLSPSMSNNICALAFGKRFDYEDKDRVYLDKNLELASEGFIRTSIAALFPWLLKIPLVSPLFKIDKAIRAYHNLKIYFKYVIKNRMDTFEPKNIRDFIDSYCYEITSRQMKDPNTSFNGDTLVSNVLDLFIAGSETVRTSILFCLYVAAAFPEHQERVKEEILDVVGADRDPEYQDIKSMPFTHSFILEVMRWKTIVAMNVPHYTLADTTIGGYYIPKNVIVYSSLWNAHHDPNYWDDPDSFVPNRFITKDGKSVSKPAHFMPFSMGKRACPGEPMAIMEMFLYFTSILQKFQIVFPEGYKPTFHATFKITYKLDPYQIRFLSRR